MSVKYERHVIIHSNGMVEKQWASGRDWTEFPCLYDDGRVGYDFPEKFSLKERAFIRKSLQKLRS